MGLSIPSASTSNRRVAPLPSLASSNNNNTMGRTTRSRSRAGTIAQFSESTSLSSNNASVPSLPTVPPSPSTYVPMQPLTPTRMSADLVVIPQTPQNQYSSNGLSRSLAGSKRKTSEIEEEEQDGGNVLSRSTRRRGNSTIAELIGHGQEQGSSTPIRTAIVSRTPLQCTPSRKSQANNLFSSLPASLSAPSHSGSFTTSTVRDEQVPPVPSISYVSAAGGRYGHSEKEGQQQQQHQSLNMSMPASAPCLEFSISAPPLFDTGSTTTSSSYSQHQPAGELFSIPDPNQLYAPRLSLSYSGQSGPSDYFSHSSSSASAIGGAFEDDAALSAYGASYPASAPAAYFDINTSLFDDFMPHTAIAVGADHNDNNGEGIWPPPPTAFPISAGPVFGGQDGGWSTSTEMGWNGGGEGGQQGVPLQAVATLLPDFLPSLGSTSGQQKQDHHGSRQDGLENSTTSRPIDGVQAIPPTPIKTGSSAAAAAAGEEAGKSDDLNERMALFASQVRRQAEKLTLADDGEEQDETRSDGSEYQDDQDDVESPSRRKRSGSRTQRQGNGSSQALTKGGVAVPVGNARMSTPQTVGKTNDDIKVKTDNRKTHNKPPESGIPRPRNAWILFRSAVFAEMKASLNKGTQQRDISRLIAEKWKNASKEEKAYWQAKAEEEAIAHREKYPGYKYNPNKGRKMPVFPSARPAIPALGQARQPAVYDSVGTSVSAAPAARSGASTPSRRKERPSRSSSNSATPSLSSSRAGSRRLSRSTGTAGPADIGKTGDIPVPAIPEQFSPTKTTVAILQQQQRLDEIESAVTRPITPVSMTRHGAKVQSAPNFEKNDSLRQTVRKGFSTLAAPMLPTPPSSFQKSLPPVFPPMPAPLPSGTPNAKGNSRLDSMGASFDRSTVQQQQQAPSRSTTLTNGYGRRTGSPIKNVRSFPASVKTFSSPSSSIQPLRRPPSSILQSTAGDRSMTPTNQYRAASQHVVAPETMPRYQQATAASLAKSTSGSPSKAYFHYPQQQTRQPSIPKRYSQPPLPSQHQVSQSNTLPQQQYEQFPDLHSPKPVLGQTYQTVDQLLRSIGVSAGEDGQTETPAASASARDATDYYNQNHQLAWMPAIASDDAFQEQDQQAFEAQQQQQLWQSITPVTASLVPALDTAHTATAPTSQPMHTKQSSSRTSRMSTLPPPTPGSASGERVTPASGFVDGIVVNGIHYEVQNTEALLEDIRSGKFGGAPISAGLESVVSHDNDQEGAQVITFDQDVFLGSADWQHTGARLGAEGWGNPETPTTAFLKLGSGAGQQYLLGRNFSGLSGTSLLLTPQSSNTALLTTAGSMTTMPQTPTLYISDFGSAQQRSQIMQSGLPEWEQEEQMPQSGVAEERITEYEEQIGENSTGSIIIHPDPDDKEEEEADASMVRHHQQEEEDKEMVTAAGTAAAADTSFGSAGSGQWALYA